MGRSFAPAGRVGLDSFERARCHAPTIAVSCKPVCVGMSNARVCAYSGCGEALTRSGLQTGCRRRCGPVCTGQYLGVARLTEDEMRKRLEMLRIEHRDLDAAIEALSGTGAHDQLQVARLKKRKLRLKDQISLLEDYLIPDIIA